MITLIILTVVASRAVGLRQEEDTAAAVLRLLTPIINNVGGNQLLASESENVIAPRPESFPGLCPGWKTSSAWLYEPFYASSQKNSEK